MMTNKDNNIFDKVEIMLNDLKFSIAEKNTEKPWGGYFVIEEIHARAFAEKYFPDEKASFTAVGKMSPKILVVAPRKRLSWQYHFRRAEIWKCIIGNVGVVTSLTDEEDEQHLLKEEDIIKLKQGERHRLVGLNDWGIVAEIWLHTDADNPSNEADIVRLQDDFGR